MPQHLWLCGCPDPPDVIPPCSSMCWHDKANFIEPTHESHTCVDLSNLYWVSYLEGVFTQKDRKVPRIAWCK